jgi:hypothetical protein
VTPGPYAEVAAYQRLRLRELRGLCESLDLELDRQTERERSVSEEIGALDGEFGDIRSTLRALGAELPSPKLDVMPESPTETATPVRGAPRPGPAENFVDTRRRAETHLAEAGIEPGRDPLLQVLGPRQVAQIEERYARSFGNTSWDSSDYLVVTLAGFVATLLDIFLVRIPLDGAFLGKMQQGSPLTKWLRENSKDVHQDYFSRFEASAKVPYDLSIGKAVDGLRPKVHRLMSPGHDPVLGFVFGVRDIMDGAGTYIDKNGDMLRIPTSMSPEGLNVAFLKVFLHLLSDVGTSAGIQPPFFTLLQLVKTKSPFVLGPTGVKVTWTDVARYMYSHGYDLRHFVTMGVVPASVEVIVRGWWLCRSYESGEDPALAKEKLTSMLLLGHAIAASGNLLKTGVIFGMNPLALNWAQMLALFPTAMAWTKESVKRDRRIRRTLDEEWLSMYAADAGRYS